jgi:hypothetical protein
LNSGDSTMSLIASISSGVRRVGCKRGQLTSSSSPHHCLLRQRWYREADRPSTRKALRSERTLWVRSIARSSLDFDVASGRRGPL